MLMEELLEWGSVIPAGLAMTALGIIVLAIAGLLKDLLTPYSITDELTGKDNPALGLSLTGYYIAVLVIFSGALYDPKPNMAAHMLLSEQFLMQCLIVMGYSLGGILLLNFSRLVVDRLVLTKFSTVKEIIQDRNVGTGAVEFGSYVASALVIAGSISGSVKVAAGGEVPPWWLGVASALAFFGLGQLVFVIYGRFYQLIAGYDVFGEIEQDNVAAGVAFGGNLIAIGVILFKAVSGDFHGWTAHLVKFGVLAVVGFVVLYLLRILVDGFLLPKATITHEIVNDRNINAAYIEGAVLIGISVVINFAL